MSATFQGGTIEVGEDGEIPLAVDLDGTLIRIDSLHETYLQCLKIRPRTASGLGRSLKDGKAAFKRDLAGLVSFDPTRIPYNDDFLNYLREQSRRGRRLGLFTAADQSIADAVAFHLGIFDIAVGSDGIVNLKGERKLDAIRTHFGDKFAYAGNDVVDYPIFAAARQVILVGSVKRLERLLPEGKIVESVFPRPGSNVSDWIRALRIRHWSKNSLVFVAPILGFSYFSAAIAIQLVVLFMALNVLSSATYIINDLFDLAADREHPNKRYRPFAAGIIAVRDGVFASVALIGLAFLVGIFLPWQALGILGGYLITTLAYSFALKRQPVLDVVILAGLFTLRVLAGSLLLPSPVSPWLLSFSMLFFLGLAMVKRYAELERVVREGGSAITARGYSSRDLSMLLAAGMSAGFSSIVVFTIYLINEQYPRDIYGHPEVLWGMMPLVLVFFLRLWHLTVHGQMDEDPVIFAMRDRFSLGLASAMAAVLLLAWT